MNKNKVYVFALGAGRLDDLSIKAYSKLNSTYSIVISKDDNEISRYLLNNNISFGTYGNYCANKDKVLNEKKNILSLLGQKNVLLGIYETQNDSLIESLKEDSDVEILAGCDFSTLCLQNITHNSLYTTYTAKDYTYSLDSNDKLITNISTKAIAVQLKHRLLKTHEADTKLYFFNMGTSAEIIILDALDKCENYSSACCIYLESKKGFQKQRYTTEDLLKLMRYLRSENGCPWDRKQTHKSLRSYIVEEAYEAAIAIDSGNTEQMIDEFGDVLLQLALHTAIAEENDDFSWNDICSAICKKMVDRHRHIFGNDDCENADEVADNWQKIKMQERKISTLYGEMENVAKGLPALMRAEKIQKKASKVGYDWDSAVLALEKVHEEADELKEEIKNSGKIEAELGDLLFAIVNVARILGQDCEKALNYSIEKFIKRIKWIENKIISEQKAWKSLTNAEMSVYWDGSKVENN